MKSPYPAIILILASLAIGVLLTWPSYTEYIALRDQVKEKDNEIQTKENYFKNLAALQEQLKPFSAQLAKIDAALPDDVSLPLLYNEIQNIAAASGLVVKSISASPSSAASGAVKTTNVELVLAGSYATLKTFIGQAQSASRILKIQSIAFSSPESGEQFSFQISLTASSY